MSDWFDLNVKSASDGSSGLFSCSYLFSLMRYLWLRQKKKEKKKKSLKALLCG